MKYLLIPLFSVLLLACNKTTEGADDKRAGQNSNKPTPEIPYPHDKDFFKSHGKKYYEKDSTCLTCHGSDGAGGNTPVSCKTCHGDFPHPKGWVMPKNHASAYKTDAATCVKCHGSDLLGGGSQVSCNTCHTTFPHAKGWALPVNHGVAAAKDKNECMSCHDTNRKDPGVIKCDQCHKIYPHPDKFKMGHMDAISETSEDTVASKSDIACSACHTNFEKYTEKANCKKCHSGDNGNIQNLKLQWIDTSKPAEPEKPPQTSVKKNSSRIPTSWQHLRKTEKKSTEK